METIRTFVTAQRFRHDVSVFNKYVCECSCFYDLFGLPRNRDKTPYVHFTREYEYDDLYKPVAYGTEPPPPEVIYHHASSEPSPDIIIDVPDNNDNDESIAEQTRYNDESIAEQTRYNDEFRLPPLVLVPVDLLSDTDSVGSSSSQDSIDIIVPDRDLPERETWDIL